MSLQQTRLDQEVAAVQSRWRMRDGMLTLMRAILLVVPLCLVLGWLDWRLDFSRPVRVLELAGIVWWMTWVVRRFLRPLLFIRRNRYTTALRIESVHKQFGGRLVSRAEFMGRMHPAGVSGQLVDAMCHQVEKVAEGVHFKDVIDMKRLRLPGSGAIVTLAVLCAIIFARPTLAGLWLQRTFQPWSNAAWPRRTRIDGVDQHYRVRRGDRVVISGTVAGEVPRSGEVKWRGGGGGDDRGAGRRSFDVMGDGSFTVRIGPLLEPISLSLSIGDAERDGVAVDVVVPPELSSIEAVYTYPEYTGRQSDHVQSGDVRVLVGTRVDLTFVADRPTKRMELGFEYGDARANEAVSDGGDVKWHATFEVHRRGQYEVRLYDEYGFSTDSPSVFVIDPIDNGLPTVRVTRPGVEHLATAATRLRLRFDAADDFGVTGAAVQWRKRVAENQEQPSFVSVAIPVVSPREQWNGTFGWELGAVDLQAGDELEYYIEVYDAGEHLTSQKTGVSGRHTLKIIEPDALKQSLEARLRDAFGEIDQLIAQQKAGRDAIDLTIVSLPTIDEPLVTEDIRRVQLESHRQDRLLRQLSRITNGLSAIADEFEDSYLAEPDRVEGLRVLAAGLDELQAGPMHEAAVAIQAAQAALSDPGEANKAGDR